MPEGDTVLSAANNLHQILAGHALVRGELNWPSAPAAGLAGRTVVEVDAYAKHMLMRLDDGSTLRTHLRMDGAWRIVRPDTREARHVSGYVRCVLATSEWVALGYRLGMLDVFDTHDERTHLAHMGPDILADSFVPTPLLKKTAAEPKLRLAPRHAGGQLHRTAFQAEAFTARVEELGSITLPAAHAELRGHVISDADWREAISRFAQHNQERLIGESLLDQSLASGIGTIHMAEGLFLTGESPWQTIRETDIPRLLATIRSNMVRACQDYPRSRRIHVHSRDMEPCHRCGSLLKVGAVGNALNQRPAFYCAACQNVHETPPEWRPRG